MQFPPDTETGQKFVDQGREQIPIDVPCPSFDHLSRNMLACDKNGREYLYEALDYVAKGKVKVMAETFPLDHVADAYEKVANGSIRFRAVMKV
jgi:D-arabinose 1-dehydrogenase-like Zn-dependent alcohol dehydrogenase